MADRYAVLMHHNIQIKKLLEPAFISALNTLNSQLSPNFVVVIGGGEAFNYFFRGLQIFETHDYDFRLVSMTSDTPTEVPYHGTLDVIVTTIYKTILSYIAESRPYQFYIAKHHLNVVFTPITSQEVAMGQGPRGIRIDFVGELRDALVDLTMYSTELFPAYTFDETPIDKMYMNRMTQSLPPDTYGFIKIPMRKHIVQDTETGLYYVKLGYLIWDTVRMLNYSFLAYQASKQNKLERYLKKYSALLEALSNPQQYMKCNSMKEYVGMCMERTAKKMGCTDPVSGQSTSSKEALIDFAIKEGYFPLSWKSVLNSLSFGKICSQVHFSHSIK
jgi:hypothetical protein